MTASLESAPPLVVDAALLTKYEFSRPRYTSRSPPLQLSGPELRFELRDGEKVGHHVAAFRPSAATFYIDYSGNGDWDGCDAGQPDRCFQFGYYGDLSLVGDWSGNGVSKIGIFRPSDAVLYLDYNGNGRWDSCATDRCLYMGKPGDVPLVGDCNGTGFAKVGTYRPVSRTFYLDYDGDGRWNGCDNGQPDRCLQIGESDDIPLVGDWNGSAAHRRRGRAPWLAPPPPLLPR